MRRFHFYTIALSGLFPFVSCTTVRKDDHSYTYVYQHNVQAPPPVQSPVQDFQAANPERSTLAFESETESEAAGARERVYKAAPVRQYYPVESVAYAPSISGPTYEPPQSVYYRMPPAQCVRPVYRPPCMAPLGFGLFFRSGTGGVSGGECRRPVNPGGRSIYYSGPPASYSLRGTHGKGR